MGKMHFHILFFRFIRVDLAGLLWYVIYAKKLKESNKAGWGRVAIGVIMSYIIDELAQISQQQ